MHAVFPFYYLSYSMPLPFPTNDLFSYLANKADITLNGAQKMIAGDKLTRQHMDRQTQYNILLN